MNNSVPSSTTCSTGLPLSVQCGDLVGELLIQTTYIRRLTAPLLPDQLMLPRQPITCESNVRRFGDFRRPTVCCSRSEPTRCHFLNWLVLTQHLHRHLLTQSSRCQNRSLGINSSLFQVNGLLTGSAQTMNTV